MLQSEAGDHGGGGSLITTQPQPKNLPPPPHRLPPLTLAPSLRLLYAQVRRRGGENGEAQQRYPQRALQEALAELCQDLVQPAGPQAEAPHRSPKEGC
ncbi:hypothetical protein GUJ93_ZPchr0010g9588 [Zizania palustris]|uniref:Uncharacterized protein n=1 Tax=Zizania palustris TaxID=103762 RepID=A0A8J5WCG3_ZIZPA|nr:hypothetical protein GUJ93_ZPchr0130g6534 [Zizania palustris]KAG8086854.1 hypothetical protein GUJ93_ZPchr0010g9588 [Zizania palustris]